MNNARAVQEKLSVNVQGFPLISVEMASTNSWLSGRTFSGRFEVGRLIARGGMSEVYQGVDLWTQNPVAIKVISPRDAADPSKQQKFYRESVSLQQIQHRNVVSVISSATEKVQDLELMYLVLEYVHGCTLEQLLRVRRVLSVREVLDIMLPTVEGLSEVHAMRYIHRDLKPSNILISADERIIKITDFGLTRREDQKWTGELMGTPQFVAPEIVIADSPVGQAADIFAIGMMMFRMLTGRFPFTGDDQQILYSNVNKDVPHLSNFAPGISGGIAGIVTWCTRRAAHARPENASELFHELTKIAASLSDQELDYRAPFDGQHLPDYSWWSDVELIASKSGTRPQRVPIISASVEAPELIQAEEIIDGSTIFDPEEYRSYDATIGPAVEPQEQDYSGSDSQPAEQGTEIPAPISAEYRAKPKPAPAASPTEQADEVDPRYPLHRLTDPPAPTSLALVALGLLFSLVMAGWVGWWLAQMLLSARWFQAITGLF